MNLHSTFMATSEIDIRQKVARATLTGLKQEAALKNKKQLEGVVFFLSDRRELFHLEQGGLKDELLEFIQSLPNFAQNRIAKAVVVNYKMNALTLSSALEDWAAHKVPEFAIEVSNAQKRGGINIATMHLTH